MERSNYQNITESEADELERALLKKLKWFRKDLPIRWDLLMYEKSTDRINNAWKKSSYWRLPDYFHLYDLPEEHHPEFYGRYNLPVNVLASEQFYKHLETKMYLDEIKNMKDNNFDSSRQKLETKKNEITSEINSLQENFFREVLHVADQMQEIIKENSHDSIDYDPFSLSQNGEITLQRIELISRAEDTYRGVICGSMFATDYLLRNFIFVNHEIVNVLKNLSKKLLQASKKYLAVQMIDEHFQNPAGVDEKLKQSEKDAFIQGVIHCVKEEALSMPHDEKPRQFITSSGKLKPTTIGKYIAEKLGLDYSVDHLRRKVNKVLPSVQSTEKRGKHFYKKTT